MRLTHEMLDLPAAFQIKKAPMNNIEAFLYKLDLMNYLAGKNLSTKICVALTPRGSIYGAVELPPLHP